MKLALALVVLFSAGCKKNIQNNDAVQQAIVNHLSKNKGISLGGMEIAVKNVTWRDNEADAVVSFKPKGGDEMSGMEMRYTLERKNNEWAVKAKADSGGHGATAPMGGMPGGMPGGGAMPPGHPPMGGAPTGGGPVDAGAEPAKK
jgi:hypothetical protein